MTCARRWWLLALFCFALLCSARICSAQEAPQPTSSDIRLQQNSSKELWMKLLSEWQTFGQWYNPLTLQLQELGIGMSELPSYLTNMREQVVSQSQSLMEEALRRQAAERSRDVWMIVAAAAVTVGVSGWLSFLIK